ncbi:alpha-1,4-glucan--maltose-1-phosphate maltosyltransferase [Flavobacteriaceae bacterium 14752]|uniref:alpha-1,4-glucan--maltose-1-phosphate maltosyltransferase n=1 Tax=Mesohalobacter salilacus TaxID=2491711 RepID=UPI000F636E15|nr:alpha-1,4-glucan--maltose-1-phosphate maltosyltransferase [Flavobacteriaceae bacterium 14752]
MIKQQRLIIENVMPQINCGSFFTKRVVNEIVNISADIFGDGHDVIQAEVEVKHQDNKHNFSVRLHHDVNDVFKGYFHVVHQGFYTYKLKAWVDHALNWHHGISAKIAAETHVKSELLEGVQYLEVLKDKISDENDLNFVKHLIDLFQDENQYQEACDNAKSDKLKQLFIDFPTKTFATETQDYQIYVDREKARFSTWYEFFPRSSSPKEDQHGTFKDSEQLLERVADMGFDTLYFPPIHPIGEKNRKGKNNTTQANADDSGVPWAIGSKLGGHKSIHPELGSLDDFKSLINKANTLGIEIAMDLAFQAAPDHPYLNEHPEWFKFRPDGSIQYAENPPKKYQDIVNFNFECEAVDELWNELLSIGLYWAEQGIKVFRVDNPHTKPYRFWNWFIDNIKKAYPDTLFLSEAFSRPKVMQQLAKQGFSQSYTYFTWRVDKSELIEYVNELTKSEMKEYFRPNFWVNTPDINPYHLQGANETMHLIRYVLAATLSSNTGVYGPVFEYMVSDAVVGKEEYLNSEKYEIKHWDWSVENKITHLISKINHIRKAQPALQQTNYVEFCGIENEKLLSYVKWNQDKNNFILIVVNLDAYYTQKGMLRLPYEALELNVGQHFKLTDLITDDHYDWYDEWNYVELNPTLPFHIFKLELA